MRPAEEKRPNVACGVRYELRARYVQYSTGVSFPGLVLGERIVPLRRLDPLLSTLGVRLSGTDSVLALLSEWDLNFPALGYSLEQAAAAQLNLESEHTQGKIVLEIQS
jgi:hypothetical protein